MRGALIIAVVFSSTAVTVGVSQYAFGLFIVPIEETFGWTRTEISASLSFAAVGGLAAPFIGRAMDRFGARPVLVLSLLVFGLSFCLRPLMTELWHWYALSFMQFATFLGLTVLPTGRLVAAWFPGTRGRMPSIGARAALERPDRVVVRRARLVVPALDRRGHEAHRPLAAGVLPLAFGQPLELGAQLPRRRRRGQKRPDHREAQPRPPVSDNDGAM